MPSFCVGVAAESYGDYGTATGPLNVDEGFALELLDALRASDIDAAVSFAMKVDHGFIQMWETMFGGFAGLPIIPVFVNAVGYPLPTYRRARLLGEAARRFARHSGKRILFAASGGLSHDPVVPRIRGADEALRNRLIGRPPLTRAQQAEREKLVKTAEEAARNGAGPCRPLNPDWDRHFLKLLRTLDWAALDALSAEGVDAAAGSGANEALCWVAAAAALSASAGTIEVIQEDYLAVPGWIAGLAHFTAVGPAAGGGISPAAQSPAALPGT